MTELKSSNFEAELTGCTAVVDFWAPWCGPCRSQAPILEEFAKSNPAIKVCKVNVDDEGDLAAKFGIMSIPTILVFESGKEKSRHVGLQNLASLQRLV